MKKNIYFVIATLLFTLALAACSGANSNAKNTPGAFNGGETSQPGLGTSTITNTQTTGLGTVAPTLTTSGTVSSTETTPMTSTLETPTLSTTLETATPSGTATTGNTTSDVGRLSNLMHYQVQSQNGQTIGTVKDLVLNLNSERVQYIIVSLNTTGSATVQNEIAVPCGLFTFPTQANNGNGTSNNSNSTTITTSNNYIILKVDDSALKNAPAWKPELLPQLGQSNSTWDQDYVTYWQKYNNGQDNGNTGIGQNNNSKLQGYILASQAIGFTVNSGTGLLTGQVQDIIFDPTSCKIQYLVLSYTANGTTGSFLIPVPFSAFQLGTDGKSFVLPSAESILMTAPHFSLDQFPNTGMSGWDQQIQTFWQSQNIMPTP